ncbi:MAG: TatD family hydrolase [Gammaproteobacteria bacterium]|nr:TatD family hydrolase [Gammaproteobacteria bacterium]
MILIDSHCHFDDIRFDPDRQTLYRQARASGVMTQIVPAIKSDWWPRVRKICNQYSGIVAAYGLHPMFMEAHRDADISLLDQWLKNEDRVAVGECGLDYFIQNPDRGAQRRLFRAQLELAQQHGLPVIIHARRALEEVLNTLRSYPGLRGVVHSFSGSEQQALRLAAMGFLMSFGGPLTYPRASRLRHLAAILPLKCMMLETDAPDQPDMDIRGERNRPDRLPRILAELTTLREEPIEEIAAVTTGNATELFSLELSQ